MWATLSVTKAFLWRSRLQQQLVWRGYAATLVENTGAPVRPAPIIYIVAVRRDSSTAMLLTDCIRSSFSYGAQKHAFWICCTLCIIRCYCIGACSGPSFSCNSKSQLDLSSVKQGHKCCIEEKMFSWGKELVVRNWYSPLSLVKRISHRSCWTCKYSIIIFVCV